MNPNAAMMERMTCTAATTSTPLSQEESPKRSSGSQIILVYASRQVGMVSPVARLAKVEMAAGRIMISGWEGLVL
ncbi:hypothetical protein ACIPJK_39070 [Streptomyces roseus]|uniref:hypothetical protein n=1 Tax=Streptomyces roseus TaxID=66430 RepID=UPI0037F6E76F